MVSDIKLRPVARKFGRKPLSYGTPRSFIPANRTGAVIYAVILADHPSAVKVGKTLRWKSRRQQYANWNLRRGNGIFAERVFILTDEYVDLCSLEQDLLNSMPFPRYYGREWFSSTLDEVATYIDEVLSRSDLSYLLD